MSDVQSECRTLSRESFWPSSAKRRGNEGIVSLQLQLPSSSSAPLRSPMCTIVYSVHPSRVIFFSINVVVHQSAWLCIIVSSLARLCLLGQESWPHNGKCEIEGYVQTHNTHTMCTLFAHYVHTICTHSAHTMCTHSAHNMSHCVHTLCT